MNELMVAIGKSLLSRCTTCHGAVRYMSFDFTKQEGEQTVENTCGSCELLRDALAKAEA